MFHEDFISTQPKSRIVQYNKKRYAVRLERVFWRFLEKTARKKNIRVGKLVSLLSEKYSGKNLTSYLRSYCMIEAEKELMQEHLTLLGTHVGDILKSCPVPGFILSHDLKILDYNTSLLKWLDDKRSSTLRNADLNDIFRPRVTRPVNQTIDLMKNGKLKQTQMQLIQKRQDDISRSARSTWLALMPPKTTNFYCLVWLSSAPALKITAL